MSRAKQALPVSLSTTAKEMDTELLRRSWGAVDFTKDRVSFDDCWKRLVSCLTKIDRKIIDRK